MVSPLDLESTFFTMRKLRERVESARKVNAMCLDQLQRAHEALSEQVFDSSNYEFLNKISLYQQKIRATEKEHEGLLRSINCLETVLREQPPANIINRAKKNTDDVEALVDSTMKQLRQFSDRCGGPGL